MRKPEVLSPAGTPEKLKAAVRFGADAVYLSGKSFGMRAGAGNFSLDEMAEAIKYAHEHGVKVYVTVNTMPRADEYAALEKYISAVNELEPDAYIVADIGVMDAFHRLIPDANLHVST
ncbi:MAG: U32 family peptidase, partial [Clostridia bacterium]|nr:U32 family peptidase [Clostridia bacterium]